MSKYNFWDSFKNNKPFEKAILKWLKARYGKDSLSIREAKRKEQKELGVDFIREVDDTIATYPLYYELKTDKRTKDTGMVVYEWEIVTPPPNALFTHKITQGWTQKTNANFLLYWVLGHGLYEWEWTNELQEKWYSHARTAKRIKIDNGKFYGIISPIPLEPLKGDAISFVPDSVLTEYLP